MSRPTITAEALALAALSLRHRRAHGYVDPLHAEINAQIAARLDAIRAAVVVGELAGTLLPLERASQAEHIVRAALSEADDCAPRGTPDHERCYWRSLSEHMAAWLQRDREGLVG